MKRWLAGALLVTAIGAAEAKDRALLIGVADYDNNPGIADLQGPRNDVTLMWRALKARGIAPENLTVLADGLPQAANVPAVKGRPTRANIIAALEQLAKDAASDPGGAAVVYYSGHGSYQLDKGEGPEDEPEPNGYDQVILPADTGNLDPIELTIENAIVDDELGVLLGEIRKNAFVWAVFDSCHSGTVTRGQDATRGVNPAKLVPEKDEQAIAQKLASAKRTTRGGVRAGTVAAGTQGDLVGFYAVDAQFQAIERSFAGYDPDMIGPDKKMGVFTNNLLQALADGRAVTYRELAQHVVNAMKQEVSGGAVPAPVFDGGGLDKPLLGTANPDGTPRPLATFDGTGLAIKAGSLLGFDAGARIAIYSAKGGKEPIGYADVADDASPAQASAVNVRWRPSVDQPGAGEEVRVAVKEAAVNFRFTVSPPTADEAPNEIVTKAIELAFGAASSSAELGITLAEQGQSGNVLLHAKNGRLWLRKPDKPLVTEADAGAFDLTPSLAIGDDAAALARTLKEDIWRLAKAAKLVRVVGTAANGESGDDGLRISAERYRDPKAAADPKAACSGKPDRSLPKLDIATSEPVAMANCDFVEIKITNESDSDTTYYVAGFYVDALGSVVLLNEKDMRNGCVRTLYPGQNSAITYRFQINTWDAAKQAPAATGEENVAILAIPQDETKIAPVMCTLVQPSISAARATRDAELASTRGGNRALGKLIGGIAGSATRGVTTGLTDSADGPRIAGRLFVFDVEP